MKFLNLFEQHLSKGAMVIATAAVSIFLLTACSASGGSGVTDVSSGQETEGQPEDSADTAADKQLVVGFSQLGAESDWRSAHSESIRSELTPENGFQLLFEDGQQKQANQIMAIRNR